ncbi:MAG: hypothetical protein PHW01_05025 [Patescibacteria group bacterium]|nr:hypothetical protein [Patescibacteria group bacterium]
MCNIDSSVIEAFRKKLQDVQWTNDAAKIEFYNLAKGVTKEMEEALFKLLSHYRPSLAQKIKDELKEV